jgi:hypothetical protein
MHWIEAITQSPVGIAVRIHEDRRLHREERWYKHPDGSVVAYTGRTMKTDIPLERTEGFMDWEPVPK